MVSLRPCDVREALQASHIAMELLTTIHSCLLCNGTPLLVASERVCIFYAFINSPARPSLRYRICPFLANGSKANTMSTIQLRGF